VVEDSANPDSTPFVIDQSGTVISGTDISYTINGVLATRLQLHGLTQAIASQATVNWGVAATAPFVVTAKSKSGAIGTHTVVQANDGLGTWVAQGSDGTSFISAASIAAAVDGTPGTNDMPGRLVFSTTADGASTPTERMRIDSSGNVGIGTSSPGALLDVKASNNGLTSITANNTLRFTDADISTAANQPIGVIEFYTSDTSAGGTGVSAYILSAAAGTSGGGDLRFGTSANASSGSPTENMRITTAGNLQFNSGYGSVATAYGCRAWVNFNGTGTVAIRASGNVSSITDNGTGDYTVNFTTAMADINYSVNTTCSSNGTNNFIGTTVFTNASTGANVAPTTSAARINTGVYGVGTFDPTYVNASVFR